MSLTAMAVFAPACASAAANQRSPPPGTFRRGTGIHEPVERASKAQESRPVAKPGRQATGPTVLFFSLAHSLAVSGKALPCFLCSLQELTPKPFVWLLSQEFELPDICRLWDSFFSDPKRFEFMTYFCCAMLLYGRLTNQYDCSKHAMRPLLRAVSGDLLRGSFADNLKLLQHYPTTIDIGALIKLAMELRNSDLDQQPLESKPETVKQTQRSSSSPVFAQLRSRSISLKVRTTA